MKTAVVDTQAPAPVMTVTVTLTLLSDGSVWMPLSEVATAVGGLPEYVLNRAKAHKVKFDTDHDGTLGVDLETGLDLVAKLRNEQDEHSSRWQAYVAYRAEKKREAAAKRDQAIREQRAAEAKHQITYANKLAEQEARRAAEERAQKEAERAEREGAPAPFEQWKP